VTKVVVPATLILSFYLAAAAQALARQIPEPADWRKSIRTPFVVDRPDALVSFEELHDIMGMHEVEELEQRFLTPEQLEAKYGRERKASIMPDAANATKPAKPGAKSKQEA
jgi:hypothetical protein